MKGKKTDLAAGRTRPLTVIAIALCVAAVLASCAALEPVATFTAAGTRDGSWEGQAFWFPVTVKVKVEVSGGKIVSIAILEHFNGKGKPAEAIVQAVVEAQTLEVDAIAGATHSSAVILKAIEDALIRGAL